MAATAARSGSRGGRAPAAKAAAKIPQLAWNESRSAPVVLVSGGESFLADRAIRRILDAQRAADPSLEVHRIDADAYGPGELLTLASPSLFAEPRLIRVDKVEQCTDAFLEEMIAYLEAPADEVVVVLRHGGGVRGKRLLDAVRSGRGGGVEVVCTELKKDDERHAFAVAEFRDAGRRIQPGALRALLSAFTGDLAELAAACQQLLADAAEEISEGTVERYYGGRVETNAFKVADAAVAGRSGEALILLRHALASGADPVPMVAAFAMKLRVMAKLWGAHGSGGELARRFGVAPWQVDRARRDSQGWSEEGLGRAVQCIAATDAAVKGASRDAVYALERMIVLVARRGR